MSDLRTQLDALRSDLADLAGDACDVFRAPVGIEHCVKCEAHTSQHAHKRALHVLTALAPYLDAVERLAALGGVSASEVLARVPRQDRTECQHKLTRESDHCVHGFARGTTCVHCIQSCGFCWDVYSSASSYGARPQQVTT